MSAQRVASIIYKWTEGDARKIPEEKQAKIINLWNTIEIKKGFDYYREVNKYMDLLEK